MMCMKALPDEEGIETTVKASQMRWMCMKALPDEEGIETFILASMCRSARV